MTLKGKKFTVEHKQHLSESIKKTFKKRKEAEEIKQHQKDVEKWNNKKLAGILHLQNNNILSSREKALIIYALSNNAVSDIDLFVKIIELK